MVNKSILLKSLHIYFFIYAMIFCGCQHTIKVQNEVKECTKGDLKNETIHSVAIKLPFLFYPERWCLNDSKLYVLNSRINPFLTIYNLQENSYIQYGNIGQGPKEFIVPSLCEMKEPEKIGIYSNSMNKLDVLHFNSDSLLYVKTLHFPLWNKQRGIPKAYTRLIQYNDSLFIGTSFMPKEISVELMNLKTEKVVNSVNFPLKPKEGEYSRPYECKIATEMNFIVAAYRYINRLEIYKLSDQKFQLNTIIGDANNQYDLYRLNVSIRLRTTCIFDSKLKATCSSWPKLGQVDSTWVVLPTCLAGVHGGLHGYSRSRVSGVGHPPSIHVD